MSAMPYELTIPAPLDITWKAFRDREIIRNWHGWDYNSAEDEITEIYERGTTELENNALHIGGHLFRFASESDGTAVRVERLAPLQIEQGDLDWDAFYPFIDEGWISFLQQLRFLLAVHFGEQRKSFYVTNPLLEKVIDSSELQTRQPGDSYAIDAPWGSISGYVWFRSELQIGLTINEWENGLLIITKSPADSGEFSAICSLYDVDDAIVRRYERKFRRICR